MGSALNVLIRSKPSSILMIGLENSGKTSLIHKMKDSPIDDILPTTGFQIEVFSRKLHRFKIFDMSGNAKYRDMWGYFAKEVKGVFFAVDSVDKEKLAIVGDEIGLIANKLPEQVPFVVMLNKQDLKDAIGVQEAQVLLDLEHHLENRYWKVVLTSAVSGVGIDESIEFIT